MITAGVIVIVIIAVLGIGGAIMVDQAVIEKCEAIEQAGYITRLIEEPGFILTTKRCEVQLENDAWMSTGYIDLNTIIKLKGDDL